MKENEKAQKGTGRGRPWLTAGLAALAVALVCGLTFGLSRRAPAEPTAPGAEQTESLRATETQAGNRETLGNLLVETPFGTLRCPGTWGSGLYAETEDLGSGYVVRFYGTCGSGTKKLFTIRFGAGGGNGTYVGKITQDGIETEVYLEREDLSDTVSWSDQDRKLMEEMQDASGGLIGDLSEDVFFSGDEEEREEEATAPDSADKRIETPYGSLYFPAQWTDAVRWDLETGEDGAVLRFYGTVGQGEYPLFTYSFEMPAEDGFRVGSLDRGGETVGVYLTIYDLPEGDWTEGEESLFGALRDQAYSVLNRLSEEPDFRPLDGEEG